MSDVSSPKFFPLSRIVGRIDQLLRPAMEKTFWLKAELSSSKTKGNNFFCDLVETNDSGQLLAQVRCTIWGSEMLRIREKFKAQGLDLKLNDGTVVGILCRLQFHPVYGMSLRGLDMDPAFALGELELKKRAIMERLKSEGLDQQNKQLDVSNLPVSIGLITGEGTAAFYDFTQTLFSSPFGYSIRLASATMQGENVQRTVLRALKVLEQQNLDLVVICRGGGSKVDLSWLDNEAIARAMADYPHPVWTGIGHEIDYGVLDLVAHQSFKTPTAIAEEIVGRFEGMEEFLRQSKHNLSSAWEYRIKAEKEHLQMAQKGMVLGTTKLLERHQNLLRRRMEGFNGRVQQKLSRHRQRWSQYRESLRERPKALLVQRSLSLQSLGRGLKKSTMWSFERKGQALLELKKRWQKDQVDRVLEQRKNDIAEKKRRLITGPIWSRLEAEKNLNSSKLKMVRASDPERNLERGYAIVRRQKGGVVSRAVELKPGERVIVKVGKGKINAEVREVLDS
jgi:exodeoxyribonuclease VII large subunit